MPFSTLNIVRTVFFSASFAVLNAPTVLLGSNSIACTFWVFLEWFCTSKMACASAFGPGLPVPRRNFTVVAQLARFKRMLCLYERSSASNFEKSSVVIGARVACLSSPRQPGQSVAWCLLSTKKWAEGGMTL